ncbi:MAG: GH3 auxin-responsive promoter family protein, partial [Flavobacteriales bacterium]
MGIKAAISRPYAAIAVRNIRREAGRAAELQQALMKKLVSSAAQTVFGREHAFKDIRTYSDFRNNIPLCDYEQLSPYIERIKKGESNVLWPGRPVYLCKTSGTTSGVKYIPVSAPSLPHHIRAARNALLCYIHETGNTAFVNGKMIFLQGSPKLKDRGGIPTGRLSGIVAHHVPSYLQKNRLPSFRTNCIEDWESKVDAIVKETLSEKMTLISGIPPWVQMYFEKLLEASGRDSISELFPHFSLFVHGGVNFKPYEAVFQRLAGRQVDSIET